MKKNKLKRFLLFNLIAGYLCAFLFILLVLGNRAEETQITQGDTNNTEELVIAPTEKEFIYIDRRAPALALEREVGIDRGVGVVLDNHADVLVLDDHGVAVVDNSDAVVLRGNNHLTKGGFETKTSIGHRSGHGLHGDPTVALHGGHDGSDVIHNKSGKDFEGVVDIAAMEAAIKTAAQEEDLKDENYGLEKEDGLNLTLAKEKAGDFDYKPDDDSSILGEGKTKKGDLYAYNYPSHGIGAGVGSPALGAGAGSAGLGAGIGEALLNGKAVPALGGVGTKGYSLSPSGGVGGLVGGAGAGGVAGITTSLAQDRLGLRDGRGAGGYSHAGKGGDYFKHLPANGALHIMMHVDGSGSILNTRKQLEVMKDTLLKDALLPYYNNDESLYERRVTIVDGNGERTLQFFKDAASKDNVLALVFQDEAQPSYHLPNFNRFPEDEYLADLNQLKGVLDKHTGLYRGIMLQVDRGRTFAKSFKEFVENSWQGKGYLENHNLKKYYWQENKHHIDNKDGIVFSDVYHVNDHGEPLYYLKLLFNASKRVGLDLNKAAGGLTDGVIKHGQ